MKIMQSVLYQIAEMVERALSTGIDQYSDPLLLTNQDRSYWSTCEGTLVSNTKAVLDLTLDAQTTYVNDRKFKITIEEIV